MKMGLRAGMRSVRSLGLSSRTPHLAALTRRPFNSSLLETETNIKLQLTKRSKGMPRLQVAMHSADPDKQPTTTATTSEPPPPPSSMEVVDGEDTTTRGAAGSSSGIASGIRLEKISMTFKNQQVLVDLSLHVLDI
jgi:hypothetical protein